MYYSETNKLIYLKGSTYKLFLTKDSLDIVTVSGTQKFEYKNMYSNYTGITYNDEIRELPWLIESTNNNIRFHLVIPNMFPVVPVILENEDFTFHQTSQAIDVHVRSNVFFYLLRILQFWNQEDFSLQKVKNETTNFNVCHSSDLALVFLVKFQMERINLKTISWM